MKSGPIIIVDDDADDKGILEEILSDLNISNKLLWFTTCKEAFHYMKIAYEQPFIVFSDINLPGQSGLDFKKQIDDDDELRKKSIPFIFYSTSADQYIVNEAYTQMTIQGFFQKGISYEETRKNIKTILDYWRICKHPNIF